MPSLVPNKHITDWIAKRRTDLTPDGMIQRFELWHVTDGEFGERLSLFDMETRPDDEDPEDLVQEIWNDAVADAGTRPQGSHQRYVVKAFRDQTDVPAEIRAFNLQGSSVSAATGAATETPTARGMLAQDMRMTDNMHAMMMRMAEGTSGQLSEQLRQAREENANLLYQRSRLLEIEQRLLDRSHEREMDRLEAQKSGERMDMLINLATTMLPVIISKLFEGKPVQLPGMPAPPAMGGPAGSSAGAPPPPPQPPAPAAAPPDAQDHIRKVLLRDHGIGQLLGSIDASQLQHFASVLRPEQAMGFMEIYQSFREDHEARTTPNKDSAHGQA